MSKLMEKLQKSTSLKYASVLADSELFNKKDVCQTHIPSLNVALSGQVDGGLTAGLTFVAGDSKHFKSGLSLIMISAYLRKYEDAVCVFYDSEFGITKEYLKANGIDPNRVLHVPIHNVEQLKFELVSQLEAINRGDKVVIFVDSLGNLASKKELEDAIDQESKVDMSRAKAISSLMRIITPYFTTKNIPGIIINHTMEGQGMFATTTMTGGKKAYLSADTIFFMGRRQQKEGTEIKGYDFVLNVEKSRYVKEKSKLIVEARWDGGVNKFSGLFDIAEEGGYITSPSKGYYQIVDKESGEILFDGKKYRERELRENKEVWFTILRMPGFREFIQDTYQIKASDNTTAEEDMAEFDEIVGIR